MRAGGTRSAWTMWRACTGNTLQRPERSEGKPKMQAGREAALDSSQASFRCIGETKGPGAIGINLCVVHYVCGSVAPQFDSGACSFGAVEKSR
mmetsp:Transcript_8814/g.17599  ORF Transcript_8814/g.17599 Transcript_8814/m.17599 type:complete len:93 (+) Transcript_8814:871-1149(+)